MPPASTDLMRDCTARLAIVPVLLGLLVLAPQQSLAAEQGRLAQAEALFKRRCATAGERITRTVKDVEGIFLLKVRPKPVQDDEQYRLDDPYGSDLGGQDYIQSFLKAHYELPERMRHLRLPHRTYQPQTQFGYDFVDTVDPKSGARMRYTAYVEQPGKTDPSYSLNYFRVVVESSPTKEPAPRYGVTYDDISTREDRAFWIAGSSLRVIDLRDGTVIAERIGYMMDRGQGSSSGGRLPWLHATFHACPAFDGPHPPSRQRGQTDRFVEKVLLPKRELRQDR